jgi:hypothetical protein
VSYVTAATTMAIYGYYILELAILNRSMSVAPIASRESMMEDESLVCTNALTATPSISWHASIISLHTSWHASIMAMHGGQLIRHGGEGIVLLTSLEA